MSLYTTDVCSRWKYSSLSKHGRKKQSCPKGRYCGEGVSGGCKVSTVGDNRHFTSKWELPCVAYPTFYSLTCRFPPETIHWSWKLSPSTFICQPDSTTQVGSTFVFLVVTMSPGSLVPPVQFSGAENDCREAGTEGLTLPPDFSARVWRHISLQLWLSLHREQAGDFTAKMIDEWLSVEKSQGCFQENSTFKIKGSYSIFFSWVLFLCFFFCFMLMFLCHNIRSFSTFSYHFCTEHIMPAT